MIHGSAVAPVPVTVAPVQGGLDGGCRRVEREGDRSSVPSTVSVKVPPVAVPMEAE